VAGIADAVAYEAEGRIEVIVDWNSDVDIDAGRWNSDRGQLGAYQRRSGASHGVGADDDGGDDSRVSRRRAARGGVYR
jgi:hypothetical protein